MDEVIEVSSEIDNSNEVTLDLEYISSQSELYGRPNASSYCLEGPGMDMLQPKIKVQEETVTRVSDNGIITTKRSVSVEEFLSQKQL
jgi:hypothetical protein